MHLGLSAKAQTKRESQGQGESEPDCRKIIGAIETSFEKHVSPPEKQKKLGKE
jgi:hypothetical protein